MPERIEAARLLALRSSGLLGGGSRKEFENQISLVRQVLDVPVAIVTLLEADKQVFAAQLGLPEPWGSAGETPLTHSFCQHVVQQKAPLVVPDSMCEPLVSENLAITDLNVRAYIGVPLALPTGEVIGALAAIASSPRMWSERDLSLLQGIGRVVSDEIATRVSETEWRTLFDELQEGFILGEVIRDNNGAITDWRYRRVNRAWGELVGIPSEQASGKTIRELFPGIEDEWVNEFAMVVETGEPVRFTREVGGIGRWYDGFAQKVGPNTFTVLFLEVTERVRAQEHRDALIELGDKLRDASAVEEAGQAAADILARTLGSSRAGYGIVDAGAETVRVLPDWCAPGVISVAGEHSFRTFGSYIEDLKAGRNVIIANVSKDPRTVAGVDALRQIDIGALVNLPVMQRGRMVGVVIIHDKAVRAFTNAELDFIAAVGDRTQAAISKVQLQNDQHLLNNEISHRLKNSLSLVQAVANQTLRKVVERAPIEAFEKRLHALSSAHDVLLRRNWSTADIADVISGPIDALGQLGRVTLHGPNIELGSRAALSLSLLTHELATNAIKYGALSNDSGNVSVKWETKGDDLHLHWVELGGPAVQEPRAKGFGSRMLRSGLVGSGDVELFYKPAGFEAHMTALLAQLQSV